MEHAIIECERGDNPWHGFTSSAEEETKSMKVRAVPSFGDGYAPLPKLAAYDEAAGGVLLARGEKEREVRANVAFFSDLTRADGTRPSTFPVVIGVFKGSLEGGFPPRKLAEYLVVSQLVKTYWHIGSTLRVTAERESDGTYVAEFDGEHLYFTNERNVSHVEFGISIDRKTGAMSVVASRR